MKHLLRLTALAVFMLPAPASAQGASAGIRVGMNLADLHLSTAPPVDSKNRVGLVAGAFATIPCTRLIGVQPEVLFGNQGTKFSEGGQMVTFAIDYVQIPVLGRFLLAPRSRVAILVGPSLGIRTHASVKGPGVPDEASRDFEGSLERFDIGLVTGASAEAGRFVFDGRYTWGLRNIVKDSGPDSAKNRVLSFSAGVRFRRTN